MPLGRHAATSSADAWQGSRQSCFRYVYDDGKGREVRDEVIPRRGRYFHVLSENDSVVAGTPVSEFYRNAIGQTRGNLACPTEPARVHTVLGLAG